MDWSPIDTKWKPLPEERDRFHDVYIDESSTNHRFLVLGGLALPYSHALQFQQDIIHARSHTNQATVDSHGQTREMKWEKVSKSNLEAYKIVVETARTFAQRHNISTLKDFGVRCLSVDTSKRSLFKTGNGDRRVGFEIEFYYFSNVVILNWHQDRHLFSLYPDRDIGRRRLRDTRDILNRGAHQWGDAAAYPFRRINFADPETCQALQVIDILIGALAYRQNRHYEASHASPSKRALCDFIWQKFKLGDPFDSSPFQRKRLFTWIIRPTPENSRGRSGPQNTR